MPHLEQIAQLEEEILRLQEQIAVDTARRELIRSGQLGNFRAIPALGNELGTLQLSLASLNRKITAVQNQITGLELQDDIAEILPPEEQPFIEPVITPAEQQNGFNLRNIAIIGAVILLLG